jgi:hypothetical protein
MTNGPMCWRLFGDGPQAFAFAIGGGFRHVLRFVHDDEHSWMRRDSVALKMERKPVESYAGENAYECRCRENRRRKCRCYKEGGLTEDTYILEGMSPEIAVIKRRS